MKSARQADVRNEVIGGGCGGYLPLANEAQGSHAISQKEPDCSRRTMLSAEIVAGCRTVTRLAGSGLSLNVPQAKKNGMTTQTVSVCEAMPLPPLWSATQGK
jgi:hypothetical protein